MNKFTYILFDSVANNVVETETLTFADTPRPGDLIKVLWKELKDANPSYRIAVLLAGEEPIE